MTDTFKLSDAHVSIVRKNHPRLTDDQFGEFIAVAEEKRLNPMLKQIHAETRATKVKKHKLPSGQWVEEHWEDKLVIVTQIDGYRSIARRDGLAGCDAAVFVEGDGGLPVKCCVTVHRWGQAGKESYTGTAYYAEYKPAGAGEKSNWVKLAHGMLEKCAEAIALRKGFPSCAGLYTDAEMDQSGDLRADPRSAQEAAAATAVSPPPVYEADPAAGKKATSGGTVYTMRRTETEPVADPVTGEVAPDLKAKMTELFGQWKNPQARRGWTQLKEIVWAGEVMPDNGKLDTTEVRQKIVDFLEKDLDRLGREEAIASQDAAALEGTA